MIALINNDVEVLTNNWGYIISSYALRLDVGCVGIKLIYPDNTIQHAGIILGIYGSAAYSHKAFRMRICLTVVDMVHSLSLVTPAELRNSATPHMRKFADSLQSQSQ